MHTPFLTTAELARTLRLSEETIYSLVHRENLTGMKIAGEWRYRESDVKQWLHNRSKPRMNNPLDLPAISPYSLTRISDEDEMLPPLKILLADDCEVDRERTRRLLKAIGSQVEIHEAKTGTHALDVFRAHLPEILIMDHNLSDMESTDLVKKVIAEPQGTRVARIVLTGHGNEHVAVQCLQSGAHDYLVKGTVNTETLTRSISYALERVRLTQYLQEQEGAVESALHAAEKANHARGILLQDLSQKIRSSVNGLVGITALLQEDPLTERQKEHLKSLQALSQDLFHALLSVAPESAESQATAALETLWTETTSEVQLPLYVLVAEDSNVDRKLVCELLRRAGCNVLEAEDGAVALTLYEKNDFDIVLVDITMPTIDGIGVVTRIREHEARYGGHTPVIALTANALQGAREEYLQAGMDEYISKPFNRQELISTMQRVAQLKVKVLSNDEALPASFVAKEMTHG
jgi:excisionase family DNA binding protein